MAGFEFKFADYLYTVQGAESMLRGGNLRMLKNEYTRMRDVAQKRLQRLQKDYSESRAFKNHPEGFQKLKDIDPRDLPKAFSELYKFVHAKGSTVTGQREIKAKTIKSWQQQGLNLNSKNYDMVIKILEEMRKRKLVYGSDKAVSLAETMLALDKNQMNKWLDHLDVLLQHTDELQEIPLDDGYDIDQVLEMIGD